MGPIDWLRDYLSACPVCVEMKLSMCVCKPCEILELRGPDKHEKSNTVSEEVVEASLPHIPICKETLRACCGLWERLEIDGSCAFRTV